MTGDTVMKCKYEKAVMEVIEFEAEDVMDQISDSLDNTGDDPYKDNYDDEDEWGV